MEHRGLFVVLTFLLSWKSTVRTFQVDLCYKDSDCQQQQPFMKCFQDYESCDAGICGCIERADRQGRCLDPKSAQHGYKCTSDSQCSRRMQCVQGVCCCDGGSMDSDGFCVRSGEKLVGDSCDPKTDRCIQRRAGGVGYLSHGAVCHNNMCQCQTGRKPSGQTCRRLRIGETGCSASTHCTGGAVCHEAVCRCPHGFTEVVPGKCGVTYAQTNIGAHSVCDETVELDRYCRSGLDCYRCPNHSNFRCWKHSSSRLLNGARSLHTGGILSSPGCHNTLVSLLVSVVTTQLGLSIR